MSDTIALCKKRSVSFQRVDDQVDSYKSSCPPSFGNLSSFETAKVVIIGATGASVFRLVQAAIDKDCHKYDTSESASSEFCSVEDYYSSTTHDGRNLEIVATCGLDTLMGNRSMARWSEMATSMIFIFSSSIDSNIQIELLNELFQLPRKTKRFCVLLDPKVDLETQNDLTNSLSAVDRHWTILCCDLVTAINKSLNQVSCDLLGTTDSIAEPQQRKSPLLLPIFGRGKIRSDTIDTSTTLATSSNSCIALTLRAP